ncbi:MAG: hypothetical protein FJ271_02240 [Planctomycetes bacterium]|nr:hypothetical protein [Planctomycetota bacterium]
MKSHNRCGLTLEQLEARDCPAVFANVVGGNLTVLSIDSQSVDVIQTNANTFQIRENGNIVRNVSGVTGNLAVPRGPHGHTALNIDLNGFATINHVAAFLGVGNSNVNIRNGTILRSLNIVGGTGRDIVSLGGDANTLAVNGATRVNLLSGTDDLYVRAGVTLNSRLDTAFVERVFLNAGSTAAKNVFIVGSPFGSRLDVNGAIGGALTYTGSMFADKINVGVGATITTNLNLALLGGNDAVDLAGSVGQDLSIFSAPFTGHKRVNLGGTVGNNATVNLGHGDDTVHFTGTITNNLNIYTRFGNDLVEFDDLSSVNSAYVHMGWSDDTFRLDAAASIAGSAVIDGAVNSSSAPGDVFRTPLPSVPANVELRNFETVSLLTP